MRIGITGHQKLPKKSIVNWIKGQIVNDINSVENITCAYSSLAIGADQLFAGIVLTSGIALKAIIPCQNYEATFKEADRKTYFDVLSKCKYVETLSFDLPSEEAFFSAGKLVVEKSDLLFAIWDGKEAGGLGGTGDVVEYALSLTKTVVHLNTVLQTRTIHNQLNSY